MKTVVRSYYLGILVLVFCILVGVSRAQRCSRASFPSFPPTTSIDFTLNGNSFSSNTDDSIVIIGSSKFLKGSVIFKQQVDVRYPFVVDFEVSYFNCPIYQQNCSGPDGIAFILTQEDDNTSYIGDSGGQLGFKRIGANNTLGITFSPYNQCRLVNPYILVRAIYGNQTGAGEVTATNLNFTFDNSQVIPGIVFSCDNTTRYRSVIEFNGTHLLVFYANTSSSYPTMPMMAVTFYPYTDLDLSSSPNFWFGVTASSGEASGGVLLRNLELRGGGVPIANNLVCSLDGVWTSSTPFILNLSTPLVLTLTNYSIANEVVISAPSIILKEAEISATGNLTIVSDLTIVVDAPSSTPPLKTTSCADFSNRSLTINLTGTELMMDNEIIVAEFSCLESGFSSLQISSRQKVCSEGIKYYPSQISVVFSICDTEENKDGFIPGIGFPESIAVVVVVSLVLIAVIIGAVLLSVPSLRAKIAPFRDRDHFKPSQ